jgi:predicted hydrocarbon binding protein
MLAIQDVMGLSGLATILRQAGLQRYANALPPGEVRTGPHAAEYASSMQAIENYYGRGARGTLTRLGYAAFNRLVASRHATASLYRLLFRLLPLQTRPVLTRRLLARENAGRGRQVTVHLDDGHLNVVEHGSDATVGRYRDSEICWVSVGEIQEALKWDTGLEYDVSELNCKAKGDPACRCEVGDPVG